MSAFREIDNPELAAQRAKALYKAKGYSDEWIEARLRSVDIRKELTDEWHNRGVKAGKEYAFLTAEISRGAFGLVARKAQRVQKRYAKKTIYGIICLTQNWCLRCWENSRPQKLPATKMLKGYDENYDAARKGGRIAGNARRELEAETGKPVLSQRNYIEHPESEQLPAGEDATDDDLPF